MRPTKPVYNPEALIRVSCSSGPPPLVLCTVGRCKRCSRLMKPVAITRLVDDNWWSMQSLSLVDLGLSSPPPGNKNWPHCGRRRFLTSGTVVPWKEMIG